MKKKAFITGINGQDGSYLAELLLEKGYEVELTAFSIDDFFEPPSAAMGSSPSPLPDARIYCASFLRPAKSQNT